MGWNGKLVGGALGLAFGPVGLALGVLAGHFYDEKLARDAERLSRDEWSSGGGPDRPGGAPGGGGGRKRAGSAADRDPDVTAYQRSAPHAGAARVA